MRKILKQFYRNHRDVLVGSFIALGVIIAAIGAYQAYAPRFSERPLKLFTVVLFDTIKLLLFSSRISILEPKPLLYDIAIWLAPFSTLVTMFTVLRQTSHKVRMFTKYLFRGGYLVFGINQRALELIQVHLELDKFLKVVCIGIYKNNPAIFSEMNKHKVMCLQSSLDELEKVKFMSVRRLMRYERIIVLENEPQMYALLYTLNKLASNAGINRLQVYAAYRNHLFYDHITGHIDQLDRLSIAYINPDALAIHELFTHPHFVMLPNRKAVMPVPSTRVQLSHAIGSAHVLLLGFNALGVEFVKQFANNGTINLDVINRVSIISSSFASQVDAFKLNYPQAWRALDMRGYQSGINSQTAQEWLEASCREQAYTHVVFTEDSFEDNMEFLLRNKALFSSCVVCFYSPHTEHRAVLEDVFRDSFFTFLTYGDAVSIYRPDIIFRDRVLQMAKSFNLQYEIARRSFVISDRVKHSLSGMQKSLALDPEKLWVEMCEHRRLSSTAMAMHQRTKKELIHLLYPDVSTNSNLREEMIRRFGYALDTLTDDHNTDTLLQDPLLSYLAGVEHLRWCNFHYMSDWTFGERDDANRVHDFLIADWDLFLSDESRRRTIIYDLLPYLMITQDRAG